MKRALLIAPMGTTHRSFNKVNIQALQELGYEVYLVANFESKTGADKKNPEFIEYCRNNSINVISIPFERASLFKNLKAIKLLRAYLTANTFDLIHAHTETGGLMLRILNGQTKRAMLVYTPHGMSFYKGSSLLSHLVYKPIERWICSKMHRNIAINEEEYSNLIKWNSKTACIVHGIGLKTERFTCQHKSKNELRKQLGIPENAYVVLSVGELNDNKNHTRVLQALCELSDRDIYYVICGVGENKDLLQKYAKNHNYGDNLKLLGYRTDIPEMLQMSDLFAFSSFHEGLPVSVMEAMASGVAIICSNIRGCVDLIENNATGLLVSPTDTAGYVNGIRFMKNNSEVTNSFVVRNREIVKLYSYTSVLEELKTLYNV